MAPKGKAGNKKVTHEASGGAAGADSPTAVGPLDAAPQTPTQLPKASSAAGAQVRRDAPPSLADPATHVQAGHAGTGASQDMDGLPSTKAMVVEAREQEDSRIAQLTTLAQPDDSSVPATSLTASGAPASLSLIHI